MIDVIIEELRICGHVLFAWCDLVEGGAFADLVEHGAIQHAHLRNPERIPQLSPQEGPTIAWAAIERLRRDTWLVMRGTPAENAPFPLSFSYVRPEPALVN